VQKLESMTQQLNLTPDQNAKLVADLQRRNAEG
jgi:hypothetical protein